MVQWPAHEHVCGLLSARRSCQTKRVPLLLGTYLPQNTLGSWRAENTCSSKSCKTFGTVILQEVQQHGRNATAFHVTEEVHGQRMKIPDAGHVAQLVECLSSLHRALNCLLLGFIFIYTFYLFYFFKTRSYYVVLAGLELPK